jgi:Cdc6-like AAA superfamily ATPase
MSEVPAKMVRVARVSQAFTPAAPINDTRLFADRPRESMACVNALFQQGLHVALYGERGVGKTSLANMIPKILTVGDLASSLHAVRVDCNTQDSFNSIWRKVFRALNRPTDFLEDQYKSVDPEEIRFALEDLAKRTLVVIDEFDRVEDDDSLSLLADTVKTLADHTVQATLMFVGVASSVDHLLGEHESISRNIRQVPMPRMSPLELKDLLDQGFKIAGLEVEPKAKRRIIYAAEGLPHFAHLLGLHAGQAAVIDDRETVTVDDVDLAERETTATHSMVNEYRQATRSPQPDHLFEQVLLACAYATRDALGFFRAGDVRAPLSAIMGQDMGIQRFQRHLNEFAGARQTLHKEGEPRRYVYRFRDPLFQPFVKITGRAKGIISAELGLELGARQAESTPSHLLYPDIETD